MLGQHLPVIELSFQVHPGWLAALLACDLELAGCCHCGEGAKGACMRAGPRWPHLHLGRMHRSLYVADGSMVDLTSAAAPCISSSTLSAELSAGCVRQW